MSDSIIKDNDVIYLKKYPRGCLFKALRLRTNTSEPNSIYRIEMISRTGDRIKLGAKDALSDARYLYNEIATLSPSEIETAFSYML